MEGCKVNCKVKTGKSCKQQRNVIQCKCIKSASNIKQQQTKTKNEKNKRKTKMHNGKTSKQTNIIPCKINLFGGMKLRGTLEW